VAAENPTVTSASHRSVTVLEPQLRHNREEFDRLGRFQRLIVLGTPVGAAALIVGLVVLSAPSWTNYLLFALVIVLGAAIGVLEVKRIAVFRRDLRERRENREHA
jgi:ABC-type nickel/cobalt efflux system permease component RcnA